MITDGSPCCVYLALCQHQWSCKYARILHLPVVLGTHETHNRWGMRQRYTSCSQDLNAAGMNMVRQKNTQTRTHPSQRFESNPHATTNRRSRFMHAESKDSRFATYAFKHTSLRYETRVDNMHARIKCARHESNLDMPPASARGFLCCSNKQMAIAQP